MKTLRTLMMSGAMVVLLAAPHVAHAVPRLASLPLKSGAGGMVCSCINRTQSVVTIHISMRTSTGSFNCNNLTLAEGQMRDCSTTSSGSPRSCQVRREDEKPISTKQFACSLSSIDGAGNPTVVVPVDIKLK